MRILEYFEASYIHRMSLIKWEAGQWMQYVGYSYDNIYDIVTLKFKSSTYGIGFSLKDKAFSGLYGEPVINYTEAYNYFKDIKYNKLEVKE